MTFYFTRLKLFFFSGFIFKSIASLFSLTNHAYKADMWTGIKQSPCQKVNTSTHSLCKLAVYTSKWKDDFDLYSNVYFNFAALYHNVFRLFQLQSINNLFLCIFQFPWNCKTFFYSLNTIWYEAAVLLPLLTIILS